jgi:hypothetical protein
MERELSSPALFDVALFLPRKGDRSLAVGASPRKTMAKRPESRVAATEPIGAVYS